MEGFDANDSRGPGLTFRFMIASD
ncbi:hypothetical protein CCACVL1_20318 [Corchorus capsularis]|uniref:Uncharacterized protein n=1 Tax=Corchorus capsularis TaxID=210143 RepID=A0A1R3HBP8_COCAP|nr:hypothetical protein CCACVL1_20318 [Corchorus capsularis]